MAVYQKTADRATITDCIQPYNRTTIQTYNPTNLQFPLVKDSNVTPQALALFRLLERLARRTGYACVKLLETLAGMLEKSVRSVRYALAELIAAGWVKRQQTRKGGVSKLFFWPLVRVTGRSRGLFSAPPASLVAAPVAVCVAAYSPVALQVTSSAPIKTAPVGKETTTQTKAKTVSFPESPVPCPGEGTNLLVAVSILKEVCTDSEALELAREASKHSLTEEQVKRVLDAYKGQIANIRNRGAWLREALRRGFSPAAPVSTHASDQSGSPVAKVVKIPKGQAFWTGQQVRPVKADSGSCATQPEQIEAGRGIGQLKATLEALRAKQ
jgi:hypothetical protein